MRTRAMLALIGLLALTLFLMESVSYAQRGGRGGGGGGAGRGGAAVGGRGGAVGGQRAGGVASGPYGGGGAAARSTGTVVGPAGRSSTVGSAGGSYTTNRGTTINAGGAGRSTTGPGGVTTGRGVGGVQVTTPGGQTATKVGSAGGIKGPNGNGAVGGRSVGATNGPLGSGASASRGGVAVGPGGAVGGGTRVGTATGPGGHTVNGASHWGAAANPYGAYRSGAVGAVGHRTNYVAAATVRTQGVAVRQGFVHYNSFTPTWYRSHPAAWRVPAWTAATIWRAASWTTLAAFCSYPAVAAVYDYGSTVVYEDNRVYYNGEPVATAEEYATQAIQLAAAGQEAKPAEQDEWTSLGVFAMVQGDEKDSNNIFQLAINKNGILRGNYYNGLTDTTSPLHGSVDKQTQRAAWTVGENKDTVYETGIGSLTEAEARILVHFGKERTQQWLLVRIDPPQEK